MATTKTRELWLWSETGVWCDGEKHIIRTVFDGRIKLVDHRLSMETLALENGVLGMERLHSYCGLVAAALMGDETAWQVVKEHPDHKLVHALRTARTKHRVRELRRG